MSQSIVAHTTGSQPVAPICASTVPATQGAATLDITYTSGTKTIKQGDVFTIAGVNAVNEQLGGARGVLATTLSALTSISNTMQQVRTNVTRLADGAITAEARTQYNTQFNLLNEQIRAFVNDATYNNRTVLNTDASVAGAGDIVGIRNETGGQYTINAFDGASLTLSGNLTGAITAPATSTNAQTLLGGQVTATGTNLISVEARINSALSRFGAASTFIENQINYNAKKVDSLTDGLGALVDADLAKESSRMKALETRQQLSLSTLSLANQAPQSLLSLFR
jgi:flagellin